VNIARVIAACFALVGFAATLVVGLYVNNPLDVTMVRALAVMAGAYIVGRLVGIVINKAIDVHLDQIKSKYPLPANPDESSELLSQDASAQPTVSAS